jgi:subtilisin family serine protease
MKLQLSFLFSFLLLLSHFNVAEGGKKEANEKGKRNAAKKKAAQRFNHVFLRGSGGGNDFSVLDDEEGDYIVVFKENKVMNEQTEAEFLTSKAKGKLKKTYSKVLQGFSARLTRKAMIELQNNPDVDYIEEDIQITINQDCTATQSWPTWGLDRIDFAVTQPTSKLDGKYSYVEEGPAQVVHVYVIDTGINSAHAEFANRLGEGFGAIGNPPGISGSWEDCDGHGTHVAGTIAGKQYGVTKNANIVLHAVRVLDCTGSGSGSDMLEAFNWVISQCTDKICVANASFGGSFSQAINNGAANLVKAGVVLAVAAGNSNQDACGFSPASAEGVITVGATTQSDSRWSSSSAIGSCFGSCVEIFAPVRTIMGIVMLLFLSA